MTPRAKQSPDRRLPRAVVVLGVVSLLTDAASDMIYPLLPAFLLSLGGGAVALGWLEGVAEAVAAALKLLAGRASDRLGARKPLIAAGYLISTLARPLFALASTPLHAVAIRAADRVGKGVRGPPRDALLSAAARPEQRGHAFGFHRMMDNLGAVVGAGLAFVLLRGVGLEVREVFIVSLVPGLAAVLVILLFVKESPIPASPPGEEADAAVEAGRPGGAPPRLPRPAVVYLATTAVFGIAASGDLFLMRRLTDLGLDVALVPIAWVSLQLAKGLVNVPGGKLADRIGRKRVLALAWLVYAASYAGFAFVGAWQIGWVMLGIYAIHYGLAEGAQRALCADYAPPEVRGRAFGWQLAIEGGMALPANVAFGLLYDLEGAPFAFLAAAGAALVASAALASISAPSASISS